MSPVAQTEYPVLRGETNEDLLRMLAEYEKALRACNADKVMINKALLNNKE